MSAGQSDLRKDDVEWVVNDNAELGVKIGNQFFFLYKGLSYQGGSKWRYVFKREFGECCHPWDAIKHKTGEYRLPEKFVGFFDGDHEEWFSLPWSYNDDTDKIDLGDGG